MTQLGPRPRMHERDIMLQVEADTWQGVVGQLGELMVRNGYVEPTYTRRMIEVRETLGPYVVIAPGIAVVHAGPGADVLQSAVVGCSLLHPVVFGNDQHDPVRVAVAVAATNPEDHIRMVSAVANVFNDGRAVDRLFSVDSADAGLALIRELGERVQWVADDDPRIATA